MSGTKFFLDSEVHFFSPYLIHRSESLSSYRFLYFVFYFNQSRGLWVLLVHELIGCFCSFENIHSGSWGFISRDHKSWGMGCFPPLSVNQDDIVIRVSSHTGNPLQYSCLENPRGGGGWWAAVHGVTRSRTRLSNFTFTFQFHSLEMEWEPTSVFLPGESQGRESLVGYGVTQSQTRLKWLSSMGFKEVCPATSGMFSRRVAL